MDKDGNVIIKDNKDCQEYASFDKNGVQTSGLRVHRKNHTGMSGWNNMFALPYEIGLHQKFEISGPAHRATGCPGINLDVEDYPYSQGHFSIQSPVTGCNKNEYAPDGEPVYKIVEEFADDNDVWAQYFFDGWSTMQSNGYTDLKDGPQASWLGYDSFEGRGITFEDYSVFIAENAPLVSRISMRILSFTPEKQGNMSASTRTLSNHTNHEVLFLSDFKFLSDFQ